MRNSLIACALVGLAVFSPCWAASLEVLVPVRQGDQMLTRATTGGAAVPVLRPAPDDALHRALIKESKRGTVAFMLKLDEEAQRLTGQAIQPTWLMLTDEEGGFAKRGFWLRESGHDRFIDQPYVSLVVDAASVADGSFEEIFAHEAGHVLLRRLLPGLPRGRSRVPHGSLTLTDDPTALDEGFAIHFQALSRLKTVNPALKLTDAGLRDQPFTPLWQSNVDGTLRIDGVRRNWFIHRQLLPPGEDDVLARRDNGSAFDIAALKNGNQMLSSEGVIATVFYRALAPQASVEGYASLFRALQRLNRENLEPDSPLLPWLARGWMAIEPLQGTAFTKSFIETTYAATMDEGMRKATETLAVAGRAGDRAAFVTQLRMARVQLADLVERARREPGALTAALGPALWVAVSELLVIDLNTAEADQLIALDGALAPWASKIVSERNDHGPFRTVSDVAHRVDVPGSLAAALETMAAKALSLGTYPRL